MIYPRLVMDAVVSTYITNGQRPVFIEDVMELVAGSEGFIIESLLRLAEANYVRYEGFSITPSPKGVFHTLGSHS